MSGESRASQRWYSEGRTIQMWMGVFWVLSGLLQTAIYVDEGKPWMLLLFPPMVALGVVTVIFSRLTRVEATREGLRIVKPPSRDRVISWRDIDDIRRDPPNAWATKLLVVLDDGEAVSLPLSISVHRELVERWQLEST